MKTEFTERNWRTKDLMNNINNGLDRTEVEVENAQELFQILDTPSKVF